MELVTSALGVIRGGREGVAVANSFLFFFFYRGLSSVGS